MDSRYLNTDLDIESLEDLSHLVKILKPGFGSWKNRRKQGYGMAP